MISIAIPVYEMNHQGVMFLNVSLEKILSQTYKDVEVVVSDHSKNDDIKNLCKTFRGKLNIVYLKNRQNIGSSSANLNNALKNCSGDLIKILMQDEYLYDIYALEKIQKEFYNNKELQWLLTGCVFGKEVGVVSGSMLPKYSEDIIKTNNTIGSPSVLTIKNKDIEFFDEDLIWVMDCEYYKRLFDKFKDPFILNEYLVFITQHKDQLTITLDDELKKKEEELLLKKYTI